MGGGPIIDVDNYLQSMRNRGTTMARDIIIKPPTPVVPITNRPTKPIVIGRPMTFGGSAGPRGLPTDRGFDDGVESNYGMPIISGQGPSGRALIAQGEGMTPVVTTTGGDRISTSQFETVNIDRPEPRPVSYTHLTLPTTPSV